MLKVELVFFLTIFGQGKYNQDMRCYFVKLSFFCFVKLSLEQATWGLDGTGAWAWK